MSASTRSGSGRSTRHVELLESELLAQRFPVFRDAEEVIADPVVRNRGTIGGSLCQADAAEDLSAVCAALKANVVIRGPDGERVVGMDGFYIGPFMTAVGADEMLTEVRIPLRGRRRQRAREGRAPRRRLRDRGRVGGGVDRGRHDRRRRHRARRGRSDHDHRHPRRGAAAGKAPSEELFAQAGEIAAEDCMPVPDGRGPVDYKRHLAGVLTKRALRRATARALQQEA